VVRSRGMEGIVPGPLAWDRWNPSRAWAGTQQHGVFRTTDGGHSWDWCGMAGRRITAVTASPTRKNLLWVGTEPSQVWKSGDGGDQWEEAGDLSQLASSSEWSFPPRPQTHHVRWIECHPHDPGSLYVAVEAGALIRTNDGGQRWKDRVQSAPRDTHELAIHPQLPDTLRSAAGEGYFQSRDGGDSWSSPEEGLKVTYLRSVALDPGNPEVIVVSAASRPRSAYAAGLSDGRLYRRVGSGRWERVTRGWPDPPDTIAALLRGGGEKGEFWAADERGIHRSRDGGTSWRCVVALDARPRHLRGFSLQGRVPTLQPPTDENS